MSETSEEYTRLLDVLNSLADSLEALTSKLKQNLKEIQSKTGNPQLLEKLQLPKDLAKLLNVKVEGSQVVLTPKSYLGSENFAKIMEHIKPYGGTYVSQGKNSHFRIPKEKVANQ
jgi:metal-dependent amidase/aminoacylase/carboxypeptidase family protein